MLRKTKNITREHEELIREKHREKAVTNKSIYNFSHGINGQSLVRNMSVLVPGQNS